MQVVLFPVLVSYLCRSRVRARPDTSSFGHSVVPLFFSSCPNFQKKSYLVPSRVVPKNILLVPRSLVPGHDRVRHGADTTSCRSCGGLIWIPFLVTTIGNRWDPSSEDMAPSSESFMLALATTSPRSRTVLWIVTPVAIYKQVLELRTEIESSRYYTCKISRTRFKSNSDHVDISLEETFLIFKMPNRRIGRLEIKCIQYTLEYTLLLIGATHSVPLSWQNTNSVSTPTQMMSY